MEKSKKTKNTLEYILLVFLMGCGIFSTLDNNLLIGNLLILTVSLLVFYLVCKMNVNTFIRYSNVIYFITLLLLGFSLLVPARYGVHRYIQMGTFFIQPGQLVVFSLLPICNFINKLKRITPVHIFILFVFAAIELMMVVMQPDIKLAGLMYFVFLILFIKVSLDGRISRWNIVIFAAIFVSVFVAAAVAVFSTPYGIAYFRTVFTRGTLDPLGGGYQIQIVDSVLESVKWLGEANIEHVVGSEQILRNMPLLSFVVRFGWAWFGILIVACIVFIAKLYAMSGQMKNSFARYTSFGIATYFAVSCGLHIITELVLGSNASQFIFMGASANLIIHTVLVAIVFALYRQRHQITVGRQLDIDYNMAEGVLRHYKESYERKMEESGQSPREQALFRSRVRKLEEDCETVCVDGQAFLDMSRDFEQYQSELNTQTNEKDLVFISYNHFDERYAAYLAEQVEKLGLKAWHFKRDMKPEAGNNDYAVAICNALSRTRIFVVMLSKYSKSSEHVKNELCLAFGQISQGTIIMPVRIEDVQVDDDADFRYFLCRKDISSAIPPHVKAQLKQFAEKIQRAYR